MRLCKFVSGVEAELLTRISGQTHLPLWTARLSWVRHFSFLLPSFIFEVFSVAGDLGTLSSMDSEFLTEGLQLIRDTSNRHRTRAEFRVDSTGRRGG
jgi:hypothetical protein